MPPTNPYSTPGANVNSVIAAEGFDESSPFSPSGRFGRVSYLAWSWGITFFLYIVLGIIFSILIPQLVGGGGAIVAPLIFLLIMVVATVMTFIFMIRRLHDLDMAGWWCLLMFVPLVNVIFGLYLLFKAGTPSGNRFALPRETRAWEKFMAIVGVLFLVAIPILAAIAIPQYQMYMERAAGG